MIRNSHDTGAGRGGGGEGEDRGEVGATGQGTQTVRPPDSPTASFRTQC